MEALLGLIALIVVALVGWAIAEFKYKAFKGECLFPAVAQSAAESIGERR